MDKFMFTEKIPYQISLNQHFYCELLHIMENNFVGSAFFVNF